MLSEAKTTLQIWFKWLMYTCGAVRSPLAELTPPTKVRKSHFELASSDPQWTQSTWARYKCRITCSSKYQDIALASKSIQIRLPYCSTSHEKRVQSTLILKCTYINAPSVGFSLVWFAFTAADSLLPTTNHISPFLLVSKPAASKTKLLTGSPVILAKCLLDRLLKIVGLAAVPANHLKEV